MTVDGEGNALHYNGTSWSAPLDIDSTTGLLSVSCTSSSFCMAVDNVGNALHYNGTSWSAPTSIDGSGNSGNGGAYGLSSVSCTSSSFCMAGGQANVLDYNGTSWSAPTSIDGNGIGFNWAQVSCTSSSFCMAVDWEGNALDYNGTSWSALTLIESNGYFESVSCTSSSFCVALDHYSAAFIYSGAAVAPLAITTTSLPNGTVGQSYLESITGAGGTMPYTWSISAGSLPKGFLLNATTGVISGKSHKVGTSNFTVKVTDSTSPTPKTATVPLSIVTGSNGTVTTVTSSNNPVAPNESVTYTATVTPISPSENVPTGTIKFTDDGKAMGGGCAAALVVDVDGVAQAGCAVAYNTGVANHSIRAIYSGDFAGSKSAVFVEYMAGYPYDNPLYAGYIQCGGSPSPSFCPADGNYTAIEATITVPAFTSLTCPVQTKPCSEASAWVGIGGAGSGTVSDACDLVQAGFEENLNMTKSILFPTSASYYAFYETLGPSGGCGGGTKGQINVGTIAPGDQIQIIVKEVNEGQVVSSCPGLTASGTWNISIKDNGKTLLPNRNQSGVITDPCSPNNSADAVLEDTNDNTALSQTGPIQFDNVRFAISPPSTNLTKPAWRPFFDVPVGATLYNMVMCDANQAPAWADAANPASNDLGFSVLDTVGCGF